jgi:hypothetical protein
VRQRLVGRQVDRGPVRAGVGDPDQVEQPRDVAAVPPLRQVEDQVRPVADQRLDQRPPIALVGQAARRVSEPPEGALDLADLDHARVDPAGVLGARHREQRRRIEQQHDPQPHTNAHVVSLL